MVARSRKTSPPAQSSVAQTAEPSPAERYAASRRRAEQERTELARFRELLSFPLDDFQVDACVALERGSGVLVAAPTGAGKTVVGEFAVHLALESGRKAFYTTPIKALSNQKYGDLVRRYGAEKVGLLTGDTTINGDAPVVVMTTEVLRNMLYAGSSTLQGLGFVVMDEVHYLADRFRGPVWEEVIIHLTDDVQLVSLSATVSNAEEFGDWLATVRGDTTVVVSEHRPVPLGQHVLVRGELLDLYAGHVDPTAPGVDPPINPDLSHLLRRSNREEEPIGRRGPGHRGRQQTRPNRPGGGRPGGGRPTPRFAVVDALEADGLLPAIVFIFSRAGCQGAVQQCLAAGVRLTSPAEASRIRMIVEEKCAAVPPEDLPVLGYWEFAEALEPGRRRAPRGDASAVQGDRRGPVLPGSGQGRVRHRDARARHQHARTLRGAGEAGQVGRHQPRRRHAGGVHPAHRAGRASRDRHRGARGRRRPLRPRPGAAGRPGVQAPLPAAVQLPPDLQHGRQPGGPGGPRPRS